jgi:membrane-associated protease RseP (regulator of RpoE activity)
VADETSEGAADATAETPTEPTTAVAPADIDATSAAAAGAPPSGLRRGVTVPAWLLGVLALIVVGLLGFGIGRWTAPDDTDPQARGLFPGETDDGGPQFEPQFPIPLPGEVAVLGVGVEDSSDPDGAEVVEVSAGSPADDAGLETGDVVTAVDGDDVGSAAELAQTVRSHEPGDEITVTYQRDGDEVDAEVTLASAESLRSGNDDGDNANAALN